MITAKFSYTYLFLRFFEMITVYRGCRVPL